MSFFVEIIPRGSQSIDLLSSISSSTIGSINMIRSFREMPIGNIRISTTFIDSFFLWSFQLAIWNKYIEEDLFVENIFIEKKINWVKVFFTKKTLIRYYQVLARFFISSSWIVLYVSIYSFLDFNRRQTKDRTKNVLLCHCRFQKYSTTVARTSKFLFLFLIYVIINPINLEWNKKTNMEKNDILLKNTKRKKVRKKFIIHNL